MKMKRLSVLLAVVMLLGSLSVFALAENDAAEALAWTTGNGYGSVVENKDGTATFTGDAGAQQRQFALRPLHQGRRDRDCGRRHYRRAGHYDRSAFDGGGREICDLGLDQRRCGRI